MKKSINHYACNPKDYELSPEIIDSFNVYVDDNQPKYQPSVVSSCCVSEIGDSVKFHSDIHLLLHDKNLANSIGPDNVKNYLDSITPQAPAQNMFDGFTDDQLKDVISDRRFQTLTDKYELQRYLSVEYNRIKSSIKDDINLKQKNDENRKSLIDILSNKNK